MIVDARGKSVPSWGTGSHWAKLKAVRGKPALYIPLRQVIDVELSGRINRGDKVLDSSQIGATALATLPSSWFGSFHREFRQFNNGDEAGICGMETYRQLAERQTDIWRCLTKPDPRGVWDTMLYENI